MLDAGQNPHLVDGILLLFAAEVRQAHSLERVEDAVSMAAHFEHLRIGTIANLLDDFKVIEGGLVARGLDLSAA